VSDASLEKRWLRRDLLERRARLSPEASQDASARIVERVLALVGASARVASFWPMLDRREVDLRELDRRLRAMQALVHYPSLEAGHGMEFRLSRPRDLVPHPLGFLEPQKSALAAEKLDVIVVPALALTRRGERLGYGGGHYDRTLGRYPDATTIAVVYSDELVELLPTEAHDRRVEWVVTDSETVGPIS
jgi:5-formyltetrahydrofolate cyclo-ligase